MPAEVLRDVVPAKRRRDVRRVEAIDRQREDAPRFQDSAGFGQNCHVVARVLEHADRDDPVELLRGKRQGLADSQHKLPLRIDMPLRDPRRVARRIHPDDVVSRSRELPAEGTLAAPDIEDPQPASQIEIPAQDRQFQPAYPVELLPVTIDEPLQSFHRARTDAIRPGGSPAPAAAAAGASPSSTAASTSSAAARGRRRDAGRQSSGRDRPGARGAPSSEGAAAAGPGAGGGGGRR